MQYSPVNILGSRQCRRRHETGSIASARRSVAAFRLRRFIADSARSQGVLALRQRSFRRCAPVRGYRCAHSLSPLRRLRRGVHRRPGHLVAESVHPAYLQRRLSVLGPVVRVGAPLAQRRHRRRHLALRTRQPQRDRLRRRNCARTDSMRRATTPSATANHLPTAASAWSAASK